MHKSIYPLVKILTGSSNYLPTSLCLSVHVAISVASLFFYCIHEYAYFCVLLNLCFGLYIYIFSLSISLSFHRSVLPFLICLSLPFSGYLFCVFLCVSVCLSTSLYISLSLQVFLLLPVCMSICLPQLKFWTA